MEESLRLGFPGQYWIENYGKCYVPWFWGAWGKGEWEHNIWTDESFRRICYGDTKEPEISFALEFYRLWIRHDVPIELGIWSDFFEEGKNFIIPIELRFWEENHLNCLYWVKLPEKLLDVIRLGQASVVFHNLPEGSSSSKFNEAISAFVKNNDLLKESVYFLNSNLKVHNLENNFVEIKTDYFGREPWWNAEDTVDWTNRRNGCSRFLSLNRRDCSSRIFLTTFIRTSEKLKNQTLWSLGASNRGKDIKGAEALEYIGNDYDSIPESQQVKDFLKQNKQVGICKVLDTDPTVPWISDNRVDLGDIYKEAYINIITETIWNQEEHIFLSEKTFKTIYACMPFIIVGTCGTLRELKKLGYKTFSRWWDESYDEEPNFAIRMSKICKVLEEIGSWSDKKFRVAYLGMRPTIRFNRKLLLQRIQTKSIYSEVLQIQNRCI